MCRIWDWQSTIVKDLNDSQDHEHSLFCRENASVVIYAIFSDNQCALSTRLEGGGVAKRAQCDFCLHFFISGLPSIQLLQNHIGCVNQI